MKAYADVVYNGSYKSIPADASGSITADSEYFKYTGRWDMSEEEKAIGHWVRPYVEIDVDTDSLVLDFSSESQHVFRIAINDDYITEISTTKMVYDISSYLLNGLNTIRIG